MSTCLIRIMEGEDKSLVQNLCVYMRASIHLAFTIDAL